MIVTELSPPPLAKRQKLPVSSNDELSSCSIQLKTTTNSNSSELQVQRVATPAGNDAQAHVQNLEQCTTNLINFKPPPIPSSECYKEPPNPFKYFTTKKHYKQQSAVELYKECKSKGVVKDMYIQRGSSQEFLLDHVLSLAASFESLGPSSSSSLTTGKSNVFLQGPKMSGKSFLMKQAAKMIKYLYPKVCCITMDFEIANTRAYDMITKATNVWPRMTDGCDPLSSVLNQLDEKQIYVMIFADNVQCLFVEYADQEFIPKQDCIRDLQNVASHFDSFVMISSSQTMETRFLKPVFDIYQFPVHSIYPLRTFEAVSECLKSIGCSISDSKLIELYKLHGGCIGYLVVENKEFHSNKTAEKEVQFLELSKNDSFKYFMHYLRILHSFKDGWKLPWNQCNLHRLLVYSVVTDTHIVSEVFCEMPDTDYYQVMCPILFDFMDKFFPQCNAD